MRRLDFGAQEPNERKFSVFEKWNLCKRKSIDTKMSRFGINLNCTNNRDSKVIWSLKKKNKRNMINFIKRSLITKVPILPIIDFANKPLKELCHDFCILKNVA